MSFPLKDASRWPLRYVHGNVLVGSGPDRAALYRVNPISYPFLPDDAKEAWRSRLERLSFALETSFSLYRVARQYPAHEYAERATGMLDDEHGDHDAWTSYLEGHERYLAQHASFTVEVYLVVNLTPRSKSDNVLKFTDRWMPKKRLKRSEMDALIERERVLFQRATANVHLRRATTREIQWLLRRASCRGLGEPLIDDQWAPAAMLLDGGDLEPLETDVQRHANAPLLEENRCLVVDSEEGRSYQAMLALGAPPETGEFPDGTELFCWPLEAVSFPVDAVLHARYMSNKEARTLVTRRVLDADNALIDQVASAHGPLSFAAEENRFLARDLDAYLARPDRPPLLRCTRGLALGASSREELDRRVETLRHHFGQTALYRPLGLQAAMFLDHLPRADQGTVRDYEDVLTPIQFSALMPIGTHEAGGTGALLGRIGSRPVLHDVTAASRQGRPPSILMAGTLGSGKTIAAELLAIQAARRGSLVVDVDPKPDHHLEDVPELEGMVDVLALTGHEAYTGMLDPLVIAPESLREDLAYAYLLGLLPNHPPAWGTEIRRAIKQALVRSQPCCGYVLEALHGSENSDGRDAGAALAAWADSGVARLGFSDGRSGTMRRVTRPVTTIKAGGLTLPPPGEPREQYDAQERVAVATLKLVAAYAMRLVQGDRSRHKLVLFDEAWFLLDTQDGRRLLDRLNRMGRAENATLVLATQQIEDVGKIEALIGTRMMFGHETRLGAQRALELIGLDPNDRGLVERVQRYRRGMCLMRDVEGRIAEVQIELVYPHLLEVLDTTPGKRDDLRRAA